MTRRLAPITNGSLPRSRWVRATLGLSAGAILVTVGVIAAYATSRSAHESTVGASEAHVGSRDVASERGAGAPPSKPQTASAQDASRETRVAESPLLASVRSFADQHPVPIVRGLDRTALDAALRRTAELQREVRSNEALLRAELAGPTRAGLFRVSGEIKQRQADRLTVWGYAIPDNADSNQLGAHMQEANILVEAPRNEGIVGGIRYEGVHRYIRESSGTNALGATVPVSVYGSIPKEVEVRQTALQERLAALADASRSLGSVYARTRRAVLALSENSREPRDAVEPLVRAVDALLATEIDEGQFSKPDPLWKNQRILLDQGFELPRRGSQGFERGFARTGTVVGFTDSNFVAGWFTRIYASKTLATYLPESVAPFLQSVDAVEQPEGIEGLMNVLTNKDRAAASGLSDRFRVSMLQSALCPELVQVTFQPLHGRSAWAEVAVLATWDGNRTSLLTATFRSPSEGSARGAPYLDLESNARDPMGINWPR